MVPDEPLRKTAENGTRYRAAGGQCLAAEREKRIKFTSGKQTDFQAIEEVKTPLASVSSKDCQQGQHHCPGLRRLQWLHLQQGL